jgi:hypothetical protein
VLSEDFARLPGLLGRMPEPPVSLVEPELKLVAATEQLGLF